MVTSFSQIMNLQNILTPGQLEILDIPNKNIMKLRALLSSPLKSSDKGLEIGSSSYISNSSHYFIRAKALQDYSFLPFLTEETRIPIIPSSYSDYNLKKGDILLSKDSNIGEVIILDKDYPNHMISGALYRLPLKQHKYYILSFIKHRYFRKQLDLLVPKGSTIRHAKTLFLDCKIPFPNSSKAQTIKFVEILTKAIIEKEISIRNRSEAIFSLISSELMKNQKKNKFTYHYPNTKDIKSLKRMNAGIFSEYFKKEEFLIKNYSHGTKNITEMGFDVSRGQNLQISAIGESLYSERKKENFYTVIKPKHLSIYGTTIAEEYLGNPNQLKTLKKGDIIFGAEGFEKGRSIVILEDKERTITNIHGITLNHSTNDIELSIVVKCFFDYLRAKNLIDLYAVGGNGGSLAMKYWGIIPIPIFPKHIKKKLVRLYTNKANFSKQTTIRTFETQDKEFNRSAGIHELDIVLRKLKREVELTLNDIIEDREVVTNFKFLN